jgi:hypothetical protein
LGILANSVDVTHSSSTSDDTKAGYVVGSPITLTVSEGGSDYVWASGAPSSSTLARSALSATTGSSVSFTPDVAGYYNVIATVDTTDVYILRISVTQTATSSLVESLRHSPKEDSTIAAPALGLTQFFSDTFDNLAVKDPSDRVWPLLTGAMGAALTDADATIQIGDGGRRVLPDATLTANRTVTLGTTSAVAGDIIEIARIDTEAFTLAVVNGGPGAGTLLTMAVSAMLYGKFRFDGTNWALSERRPLS